MRKFFLLSLLVSGLAHGQWDDSFSTRLNPDLLISGVRCHGGELSGRSLRVCREGQWLITLDSENHCDEDVCTEAEVLPFIAKLKQDGVITPPTLALYEIVPKDFVTGNQRRILGRHWVKFDLNSMPLVMRRTGKGYGGMMLPE